MTIKLILGGLVTAAVGLYLLGHSLQMRIKGTLAYGIVTRIKILTGRSLISIRFITARQETIKFRGDSMTAFLAPAFHPVGSEIAVLYDPEQPHNASAYAPETAWFLPMAIFALGIFEIYMGLAG